MKMDAPDSTEQVALVTGQVLHEGTNQPVIGTIQVTTQETPVSSRTLSEGRFVLSGQPELLFPELSLKAYQMHLKIRVISSQFREGFAEQALVVTIPQSCTFRNPDPQNPLASMPSIQVYFAAEPVFIRGYVFNADPPVSATSDAGIPGAKFNADPPVSATSDAGIPGANITITQGGNSVTTTSSNANGYTGRYSFQESGDPNKPQAFTITASHPATISCKATNFKPIDDRPLIIDFSRSLHEEYFYLAPS